VYRCLNDLYALPVRDMDICVGLRVVLDTTGGGGGEGEGGRSVAEARRKLGGRRGGKVCVRGGGGCAWRGGLEGRKGGRRLSGGEGITKARANYGRVCGKRGGPSEKERGGLMASARQKKWERLVVSEWSRAKSGTGEIGRWPATEHGMLVAIGLYRETTLRRTL